MRSLATIRRDIVATWPDILVAAESKGFNRAVTLPANPTLTRLESSAKSRKSRERWRLAILYLSPSTESGINVCAAASKGCISTCLVNSGRLALGTEGAVTGHLNARLWKTALFFGNRPLFVELLKSELAAHVTKGKRDGFQVGFRPNGTSDIAMFDVVRDTPDVQWYDYTKVGSRLAGADRFANYHVTFSWSGDNEAQCRRAIDRGINVAVPFAVRDKGDLPLFWKGIPVVSGDEREDRFNDGRFDKGHIIGLTFKCRSRYQADAVVASTGGFVQPAGESMRWDG